MKWVRRSSKKLLRIKVTSHESELEFNISSKSTGKYLFDLVCSTIGLRETWYFGLQNYLMLPNGKMRLLHWLKLDKKIVSQKGEDGSSEKQWCYFFHTKFFPEDIEQELIQATTRHLFYLSVKDTILNQTEQKGDLCPNMDVAIVLASLAAQADYGDVCEDSSDGKDDSVFLPSRLLRLIPKQLVSFIQSDPNLAQKLKNCYKSYKGINRDKAELQYLKIAQLHHLFGVDYFPIVCVRMKCPRTLSLTRYLTRNELAPWHGWDKHHTNAWLGVTAAGIQLYGRNQRERPRYTFQWNIIKNVSYRERKFTIKLIPNWQCSNTKTGSGSLSLHSTQQVSNVEGVCQQRVRKSSHTHVGRSPLLGCGESALAVGSSGACGSGTSGASLPSTPLSTRLMLPAISSTTSSGLGPSLATPVSYITHRDASCERVAHRIRHSPTNRGNELTVTGTSCLTAPRPQTTADSSGGASTNSSKSLYIYPPITTRGGRTVAISKSSSRSAATNPLISVVEVWLADPGQAKTVISMCAGNHALFMRRRQPDSVEVQQMRAQACEERARREVERIRLARARAEKAEALEAKLALESRCAQLELALRRQQTLNAKTSSEDVAEQNVILFEPNTARNETISQTPYQRLSIQHKPDDLSSPPQLRHSIESHPAKDPNADGRQFQPTSPRQHYKSPILRTSAGKYSAGSAMYSHDEPSDDDEVAYEDYVRHRWDPQYIPQTIGPTCQQLPIQTYAGGGSASTPATPYARRSSIRAKLDAKSVTYTTPQPSRRRYVAETLDSNIAISQSSHCVGRIECHPRCPHAQEAPFSQHPGPCVHQTDPFSQLIWRYPAPPPMPPPSALPIQPHPMCSVAPGSLPTLHKDFCTIDGVLPWNICPGLQPCACHQNKHYVNQPPFQMNAYCYPHTQMPNPSMEHKLPIESGKPFRDLSWYDSTGVPLSAISGPTPGLSDSIVGGSEQISTSLSALLSPIACQRWPRMGAKQIVSRMNAEQHKSVPFLNRSTSPFNIQPSCALNPYYTAASINPMLLPAQATALADPLCAQSYMGSPEQAHQQTQPLCGHAVHPMFQHICDVHRHPQYPFLDGHLIRNGSGVGDAPWIPPPPPPVPSHAVPPEYGGGAVANRDYWNQRLQEERAHFERLQAEYLKQLRDTWACLHVSRTPGDLKPPKVGNTQLPTPSSNNELRIDPAGSSDAASSNNAPGGAHGGYVGLDQLGINTAVMKAPTDAVVAPPPPPPRINFDHPSGTQEARMSNWTTCESNAERGDYSTEDEDAGDEEGEEEDNRDRQDMRPNRESYSRIIPRKAYRFPTEAYHTEVGSAPPDYWQHTPQAPPQRQRPAQLPDHYEYFQPPNPYSRI